MSSDYEAIKNIKAGQFIVHDAFIDSERHLLKDPKVISFLYDPRYVVGKTPISSRILSHWIDMGLVQVDDSKHWRRFSLIELIWVEILTELREFGVSLDKIKNIREDMNFRFVKGEYPSLPLLALYLTEVLRGKEAFILVFSSGHAEIADRNEYELTKKYMPFDPHVLVDLKKVFKKVTDRLGSKLWELYDGEDIKEKLEIKPLSDNEAVFLDMLSRGEIKQVEIKFRNGKTAFYDEGDVMESLEEIIGHITEKEILKLSYK